jgi:hypothetical protein
MVFHRFTAEPNKKIFKKESQALNPIKDRFTYEKDKLDIKIIPSLNDFIILAKPQKTGQKTIYVF